MNRRHCCQRLARLEPGSRRWHTGLALAQEQLGLEGGSIHRDALALGSNWPGGDMEEPLGRTTERTT